MTKEELNSDRINYLVWRYLQESNYRETAVKLQSEWNLENPQLLDFAPHVKQATLVSVLQKGLLYHEAERAAGQPRRGVAAPLPGFFGPVAPFATPPVDEIDYENARKRSVDQRQYLQNGSPAKRPRHSNGYENGFESGAMDIDEPVNTNANGNSNSNGHSGHGHAYPSPQIEEPEPPIVTIGPEQSTQVEKVTELSSETTFLTLSDPAAINPSNPVLLHCEWNPTDPTILAAAGTEALARLWTVSSRGVSAETEAHVNGVSPPPFRDLLDETTTQNSQISALSWTSDGSAIAIASDSTEENSARISLWASDGTHIQSFSGFEPPVTSLRWNTTNTLLLALMPEDKSSSIKVFSPAAQRSAPYTLPSKLVPLDAVWKGTSVFLVCGEGFLYEFNCADAVVTLVRKYETRKDSQFSSVIYDGSLYVAAASESGFISVWDNEGVRTDVKAHKGAILSLAFAPFPDESGSVLASAGEDGLISIWDCTGNLYNMTKPRCSMTMESAIVAMAFTPDGAFIAGATVNQILIWNVEDTSAPRARWVRGPEPGWKSPILNELSLDEDQHSLCWDADGQKLAYGVNNQLAVIKWRPFGDSINH